MAPRPPTASSASGGSSGSGQRPKADTLPEALYPPARIKWYPTVEQHPSIFLEAGPNGFVKPSPPQPAAARAAAAPLGAGGFVTVSVTNALQLMPLDGGDHIYRVTAFYQSEGPKAVQERMSEPEKGRLSSKGAKKEDCGFHKRLVVPYSSREQLLKVAVYQVGKNAEGLIGEATVHLADPASAATAPWPLMRNFEEQGMVMLHVQMPGIEPPPSLPSAGPAVRSGASAGELSGETAPAMLLQQPSRLMLVSTVSGLTAVGGNPVPEGLRSSPTPADMRTALPALLLPAPVALQVPAPAAAAASPPAWTAAAFGSGAGWPGFSPLASPGPLAHAPAIPHMPSSQFVWPWNAGSQSARSLHAGLASVRHRAASPVQFGLMAGSPSAGYFNLLRESSVQTAVQRSQSPTPAMTVRLAPTSITDGAGVVDLVRRVDAPPARSVSMPQAPGNAAPWAPGYALGVSSPRLESPMLAGRPGGSFPPSLVMMSRHAEAQPCSPFVFTDANRTRVPQQQPPSIGASAVQPRQGAIPSRLYAS